MYKKAVSLILAFSLSVLCSVPAFAADRTECGCGHTPVIVISGVGSCPFYIDKGTQNEHICFPPQLNAGKIICSVFAGIFKAVVKRDFNVFADALADVALGVFEEFRCDENGNSKYNVSPETFPGSTENYDEYLTSDKPEFNIVHALVDEIGADHTYFYNYDWRLDPCANADNLDAFISGVLDETNHEKVSVVPCSMGGVQTLAYFAEYGGKKIEKAVFMSPADSGLMFVGNLFNGELQIIKYDVFQYLKTLKTGNALADAFIGRACGALGTGMLFNGLFRFVNGFGERLNPTAIDKVLKNTFASMPGMWSFVRPEKYEGAKALLLGGATDEFIQKADRYQYEVRRNRDEILNRVMSEDGTAVVYCSHYDKGSLPVTSTGSSHGDCLIETTCTSGGAFCAKAGTTLPVGYVQKNYCSGHNHLSADRIIDASCCTLPDSTWFFKGISHVGGLYGSDQCRFIIWALGFDGQPTVFDNDDFPQFLQADHTMMKLTPVAASN